MKSFKDTPKYAIIVAGGSGKRMNSEVPKQFISLLGKPMLMHTLEAFKRFDPNIKLIVVLPADQIDKWNSLCSNNGFNISHTIVEGGSERFYSVKNGISVIKEECLVAIHDGVRPLVSKETISSTFIKAFESGAAIPVISMIESLRQVGESTNSPADRNAFRLVQTPQVFEYSLLKKAYEQNYNPCYTDDAMVVESSGVGIFMVEGNRENIKITTPQDIITAEALLKSMFDSL